MTTRKFSLLTASTSLILGISVQALAQAPVMTEPSQYTSASAPSSMPLDEQAIADNVVIEKANETQVQELAVSSPGAEALIGTGYTYSHDWGDRRGRWIFNLNWGVVRNNSRVFVSTSECRAGGGKFIGSAVYTVHNVAQVNGRVSTRINIDWREPIRVCVDYLVINP